MDALWDMETLWFRGNEKHHVQTTFHYRSWNEFRECKPYKLWKPYIVSSWSWKPLSLVYPPCKETMLSILSTTSQTETASELLQILFISPDRFSEIHRVEIHIQKKDEPDVRKWLKNHMPTLWKL